jgi:hypothetical protein
MGTKEQYEASKGRNRSTRDKNKWWFRQREPIDRFTGWLVVWTSLLFLATVATAVVLIITDRTFDKQLSVMQSQLKEMRDQQRAWVYATPEPTKRLTFDTTAVRAWFSFRLKNPGHLPAHSTTIRANLNVPTIEEPGYLAVQKRICAQTSREYSSDTVVLFPGQEFNKEFPIGAERRDVESGMRRVKTNIPMVLFYLIGCIDYRIEVEGEHHQTGFGYSLVQKKTELSEMPIDLREAPIDADSLRLVPLTIGEVWFAN